MCMAHTLELFSPTGKKIALHYNLGDLQIIHDRILLNEDYVQSNVLLLLLRVG